MYQCAKVQKNSHFMARFSAKNTEKRQKQIFLTFFEKKVLKKFASFKNGSNFATLLKGDIV